MPRTAWSSAEATTVRPSRCPTATLAHRLVSGERPADLGADGRFPSRLIVRL